ncbi:SurA N-terminal domain-containing protein [Streptomyces sp. bgisy100]|uniref:SurA N-terminal domain-containing protein n=1 Tax=Streptomyces sp. bgisy100 TaxID=3413783 RepID=UPI003D72B974
MLPYRPRNRWTALSVTAAALLTASPLLTACGSNPHPGAAAVVDGDRITVSQLQDTVEGVREAQRKVPQSAQLIQDTGQLSRATLNSMIFDRVLARAAGDAGIAVSRRDIQRAQTAAEQGAGGAARLRALWLQQYAIGPGQVTDTVRNQLMMDRLARSLGVEPNDPKGQTKLGRALQRASATMGIDVNPRYGTWDEKKVLLGTVKESWLRKAPPAPGEPA